MNKKSENIFLHPLLPKILIAGSVIVMLLFTFLFKIEKTGKSATTSQPNIIFIIADDLDTADLPYMPKLQQYLTSQGTTFNNYLFNWAQCCPSRSSILRGQNANNTQIQDNSLPNGGFGKFYNLGEEAETIAVWLQRAGYTTFLEGKYLNGYPNEITTLPSTYIPPGWNQWYGVTSGITTQYKYTLNENGTLKKYDSKTTDYMTDVLATKAASFITSAPTTTPFFMYIAPTNTHGPFVPAPRHATLFSDQQAPRTPNFNEADVSDKPKWMRKLPLLTTDQIASMDADFRNQIRSAQSLDDMIENIYLTLQSTGQLNNTYIFFSSDNGLHFGNHRMDKGKDTEFEEDIRVPLIVRGPGVTAGQVVNNLIGNIDLAPTFANIGSASIPITIDGRSFAGLLSTNYPAPTVWRNGYLIGMVTSATSNDGRFRGSQAVRTDKYLYAEYKTGEHEFYDLTLDPDELTNTYPTVSVNNPSLISNLAAMLAGLRTCSGDACRTAEQLPVDTAVASPTPTLVPPTPTSTSIPPSPTPTL